MVVFYNKLLSQENYNLITKYAKLLKIKLLIFNIIKIIQKLYFSLPFSSQQLYYKG